MMWEFMKEKKKCLCDSSDVRVVACSGASNVGQIANQAALDLAKSKVAGFFCLAGVGDHYLRNGQISEGSGADDGHSKEDMNARGVQSEEAAISLDEFYEQLVKDMMLRSIEHMPFKISPNFLNG